MRRNAESLLVLAGEEAGRKWTEPVFIGNVVRAALGEVEQFARVRMHDLGDTTIAGTAVADVSHIIAELLENALTFSPPDSPVDLYARHENGSYVLTIVDSGIGMSADEFERANRRLVASDRFTIAPSRFLGHYVVANLAARHDITVQLQPSPSQGVMATIALPAAILATSVPAEPTVSAPPVAAPAVAVPPVAAPAVAVPPPPPVPPAPEPPEPLPRVVEQPRLEPQPVPEPEHERPEPEPAEPEPPRAPAPPAPTPAGAFAALLHAPAPKRPPAPAPEPAPTAPPAPARAPEPAWGVQVAPSETIAAASEAAPGATESLPAFVLEASIEDDLLPQLPRRGGRRGRGTTPAGRGPRVAAPSAEVLRVAAAHPSDASASEPVAAAVDPAGQPVPALPRRGESEAVVPPPEPETDEQTAAVDADAPTRNYALFAAFRAAADQGRADAGRRFGNGGTS
jgi:hypothetical protein